MLFIFPKAKFNVPFAKKQPSVNFLQKNNRPDFIVGKNGVTIPTSRKILEQGFQKAGFKSFPPRRPGIGFHLDNMRVRIMEPSKTAPLRASFENLSGQPITPFTLKPPQPPKGPLPINWKDIARSYTHIELHK